MSERILVVLPEFGFGGVQRSAVEISRMLAPDHEVTLVSLTSVPNVYDDPPGVEVVYLPTGTTRRAHDRVRRVASLRRVMDERDPIVVLSLTPGPTAMALLAAPRHTSAVVFAERTDCRFRHDLRAVQAARALCYRRADRVVVQTHSLAVAAAARSDLHRVSVIPNTLVPEYLAPGRTLADPTSRRMVLVGRLVALKQVDHAIRAFASALEENPGWTLRIVGEGPMRAELEALVRSLGLDGAIEVVGARPDVREEYVGASLLALTSAYEGFPNALVEAMSCGTVPISYRCPSGPDEIIDDGRTGWLVAANDVGALARTMARAMSDEDTRTAMSRAAVARSEDFSPAAIAPLWRELVADVADVMRYRRRMVSTLV